MPGPVQRGKAAHGGPSPRYGVRLARPFGGVMNCRGIVRRRPSAAAAQSYPFPEERAVIDRLYPLRPIRVWLLPSGLGRGRDL